MTEASRKAEAEGWAIWRLKGDHPDEFKKHTEEWYGLNPLFEEKEEPHAGE